MKKKFYKVLSLILSITLLLSVCFVSGAFNVFADEKITDYYVKGNGTGDGSSPDAPAPSVEKALKTMVQKGGLTADDTANVWIMQDAAELYGTSSRTHNLAYWGENGAKTVHENTIIVKPYKGNTFTGSLQDTVLMCDNVLGGGNAIFLGGPTVFENIKIVHGHKTNYNKGTIVTEGNSLTIDTTVDFAYINGNSGNDYTVASGVTSFITDKPENTIANIRDSINASGTASVYEKPYTVKITHGANGQSGPDAYVFGDANAVFKENATLIIDFKKSSIERIYLGSAVASYSLAGVTSTYEKDINIKLRNTSGFAFRNDSATPLIIWGGINMIVSDTVGGTAPATSLSTAGFTKNKAGTGNAPFWVLKVNDNVYDYIDFYGETGKFKMPSNCTAVATHTDGTVRNSNDDAVLDLSDKPGEWKVAITVNKPKVYDYYVKAGGTGDGTSVENAAPTVAAAIATMNSLNLNAKETANIWIIEGEALAKGSVVDGNRLYHNQAYWSETGTVADHVAKIIVKPYSANSGTTYLFTGDKVGDQDILTLGGPTEIDGVKIVFGHSNGNKQYGVNLNGKNAVIGSGVSYAYVNKSGATAIDWDGTTLAEPAIISHSLALAKSYDNPFTVTFNKSVGAANSAIEIPGFDTGAYTFKDNVTLDFAAGVSSGYISTGTKGNTSTINFKKNLNFKINGGLVRFRNAAAYVYTTTPSVATIDGGLQFIVSNDTTLGNTDYPLTNFTNNYAKADGSAADVWVLKTDSANLDYIDFQGEAGKFKIASNCAVKAVNVKDTSLVYNVGEGEGLLNLEDLPGEYTLEFTVFEEKVYDYYVKAGGKGDGSNKELPAPDIATAIRTINSRKLVKGEVATIHVMQNITAIEGAADKTHNLAYWGDYVEHDATVVIKPYANNTYSLSVAKTLIAHNKLLGSTDAIKMGGPVEFGDVELVYTESAKYNNKKFIMNGNSVKFATNTTFAYFNLTDSTYAAGDVTSLLTSIAMYSMWLANDTGTEPVEYTEPVKVELNKGFSATGDGKSRFNIGDSYSTYKENVTIQMNLGSTISNPRLDFGKDAAYTTTFEKNLNVKLIDSLHFGYSVKNIVVKGGFHFILAEGAHFHTNYPYNEIADGIVDGADNQVTPWIIKVADNQIDYIGFGTNKGEFVSTHPSMIAVATKVVAEGETAPEPVVANADGILDLSAAPGEYTISFVNEFSADGETIRVFKDMDLDLANQKHLEKIGKLFIGWKYRGKEEYPQTVNGVAKIKAGSILEAQYIDKADTDFELEDVQIRVDGANDPAIRFIINKNKTFESKLDVTEYGAIFMEANKAQGFEIFLDKEPVVAWYAYANENGNNAEWAVRETTGYKPTKVTADPEKVLEENETDLKYTICLTDISEANYRTFYALRGYIKFVDKNGIETAAYTEQEVSSLYKEACDINDTAVEDRTEMHLDVIAKAEANKIAEMKTFKNSLQTPSEAGVQMGMNGQPVTDAVALENNALIYTSTSYGKQYLRTITVNTGMDVEAAELLFVTDTHVTYSNEKDIALGYQNAMGYYKSRAYYGSSFNSRSTYAKLSINSATMAALFDKVVLGGDMADYVSYGNYESIKRIWSDRNIMNGKSLKGTISMTPGNHEGSQASATPAEKMDGDVLHNFQNQYMVSNSEIDYDIVYKADGKTPNYMTVTMDNASTSYTYSEAQYEILSQYLAYAKENNIPVLLFQHIPMATGDEADSEYWYTAPEYLRFEAGGHQPHPAVYKQWLKWKSEHPNATASEKAKYADTLYNAGTNDYGEAYPKGWQYTNIYDGSGYAAYSGDSETALKVRQLITSNSDVIKAIICGHNHSDYTTGVVATDAEGNKLRDKDGNYITIPQFTTTAGYQHGSMIVNIK